VIAEADDRQEVFRCLKLGAADYLVKPLRLQELRNIWTRVWWHQVRSMAQHSATGHHHSVVCSSGLQVSDAEYDRAWFRRRSTCPMLWTWCHRHGRRAQSALPSASAGAMAPRCEHLLLPSIRAVNPC
jgi:CheY-like chemotaxis protein